MVGRDRKSQLGIGRRAGWKSHLARASEDLHYFAGSRLSNARRGGAQIGNRPRVDPRGDGPRARSQTPFAALFSIARGAIFQFPGLESATHRWLRGTCAIVKGAKFSGANQRSLRFHESRCERIHCGARHPAIVGLHIPEITGSRSTFAGLPAG